MELHLLQTLALTGQLEAWHLLGHPIVYKMRTTATEKLVLGLHQDKSKAH
jgi:hypothetical protein